MKLTSSPPVYMGIAFRNLKDGNLRNLSGPQGAQ